MLRSLLLSTILLFTAGASFAGNDSLRVMLFLSETCPICRNITPEINRISGEFPGKPIQLIGVFPNLSLSNDSTRAAFSQKYKLDFPMLADTGSNLTRMYDVSITPEVVVVNSENRVVYRGLVDNSYVSLGKRRQVVNEHYLYDAIRNYFDKKPVSPEVTKAVGCKIQSFFK